ncbi:hypothetical protein RZE82_03135 [Mollicutes bacterium LVI A0039]|nr:hypothetical protein RZE82_03135 [Mollicutes bacterium LVI A0039]
MELTLNTTGVFKQKLVLGVDGVEYPITKKSVKLQEVYTLDIEGKVTEYTYKMGFSHYHFYANQRLYDVGFGLTTTKIIVDDITFSVKKSNKKYCVLVNDTAVAVFDEYSLMKSSFKLTTSVESYYEYMIDIFLIYHFATRIASISASNGAVIAATT